MEAWNLSDLVASAPGGFGDLSSSEHVLVGIYYIYVYNIDSHKDMLAGTQIPKPPGPKPTKPESSQASMPPKTLPQSHRTAMPPNYNPSKAPSSQGPMPPSLHASKPPSLHASKPSSLHAAKPPSLHASEPPKGLGGTREAKTIFRWSSGRPSKRGGGRYFLPSKASCSTWPLAR